MALNVAFSREISGIAYPVQLLARKSKQLPLTHAAQALLIRYSLYVPFSILCWLFFPSTQVHSMANIEFSQHQLFNCSCVPVSIVCVCGGERESGSTTTVVHKQTTESLVDIFLDKSKCSHMDINCLSHMSNTLPCMRRCTSSSHPRRAHSFT